MTPVAHRPISMIFGKIRTGSLVSSAMFTESSNPTIAKNASAVAAVTALNGDSPSGTLKSVSREVSPSPPISAQAPIPITISRPLSSTQVSTTFAFTLSPTPRRFTSAISVMNASEVIISSAPRSASMCTAEKKFAANAFDALDAEVRPEHITANVSRKVRKWIPNALCV